MSILLYTYRCTYGHLMFTITQCSSYAAVQVCAAYESAVVADQNTKLSVFAVRPALYSPVFCWITECLGCLAQGFGALLLIQSASTWPEPFLGAFTTIAGILVAMLLFVLLLGLGGIGAVLNPCRDLGMRFMHWLLPIPGKGSSEWQYAAVYLTADIVGSMAGAGLGLAMNKLTAIQ